MNKQINAILCLLALGFTLGLLMPADAEEGVLTANLTVGTAKVIHLQRGQAVQVLKRAGAVAVIMVQLPDGSNGVYQVGADEVKSPPQSRVSSPTIFKPPSTTSADVTKREATPVADKPIAISSMNNPPVDLNNYKILEPKTSDHLVWSKHFVARWKNGDGVKLSDDQIHDGLNRLENMWDLYTKKIGFPEPYLISPNKYRISIYLSDKGWASGGGTGTDDPAMWLNYHAFQDAHAQAHEFAHALQFATRGLRDPKYTGWFWECHAEWMAHQTETDYAGCSEQLINAPHIYWGSTRDRYGNWLFLEFLKDKFGYPIINDIWTKAKKMGDPNYQEESPLAILMRNMNWSESQLNDEFVQFAMHNVTWDYAKGKLYRKIYGSYENQDRLHRYRTSLLVPVTGHTDTFAIPEYHAPQQYGYNMVKLDLKPGAQFLRIHFQGLDQKQPGVNSFNAKFDREPSVVPNPDSDWRWGVVTVTSDRKPQYSSVQSVPFGTLTVPLSAADEAWLVVMATPSHYHKISWDQMYYTLYRYPWRVTLEGGFPAGTGPVSPPPGKVGAPHRNGGGWVEATAQVDPNVYLGPETLVLDNARVIGNARIEGRAIIKGNAQIKDHAYISDYAWVCGTGIVAGQAQVKDEASVYAGCIDEDAQVGAMTLIEGKATHIHGHAVVRTIMNAITDFDVGGTAQLLGDMELRTNVSKGVFYGFVTDQEIHNPLYGSDRTEPHPEITRF